MTQVNCRQAADAIRQGKIVAYPTEAVFGLGCDPLNEQAVKRLLEIKQRPVSKGLILIAADFEQLKPFVSTLQKEQLQPALDSWPGPYTWLIPAHPDTPYWLTGEHSSIAVRVTDHPVAGELCQLAQSPLVSTSANRSGQPPLRSASDCRQQLPEAELVVDGEVDPLAQPSVITDLLSGAVIRS